MYISENIYTNIMYTYNSILRSDANYKSPKVELMQ